MKGSLCSDISFAYSPVNISKSLITSLSWDSAQLRFLWQGAVLGISNFSYERPLLPLTSKPVLEKGQTDQYCGVKWTGWGVLCELWIAMYDGCLLVTCVEMLLWQVHSPASAPGREEVWCPVLPPHCLHGTLRAILCPGLCPVDLCQLWCCFWWSDCSSHQSGKLRSLCSEEGEGVVDRDGKQKRLWKG